MDKRHGRIAYQGEPGANSHIACNDTYPEMEPVACKTFEDALSMVERGDADLAMIPVENKSPDVSATSITCCQPRHCISSPNTSCRSGFS